MARFSNAVNWDPGVLASEDTDPGPPSRGSTYRLVVGVLGRRVQLEYRIEEIDPPRRVVLQAQNATIRSTDVIEVSPAPGGGSTVTYAATLRARGPAVLLAPLVGMALRRIGDRAAAGLRTALAA
jgi:carbon monoxide dehydrogenase subunit G